MKLYLSFSFLILFAVSLFSCDSSSTSEHQVHEVMDVIPEAAFAVLQLNGNQLANHAENSERIPRALFKPLLNKTALYEFKGVNYDGQSVAFAELSEDNTFVALVYALSSPSELKNGLLEAYPQLLVKEEKGYSAASLNNDIAIVWNEKFMMVGLSPMAAISPVMSMFSQGAEDLQEVFGKYLNGKGGPSIGQDSEFVQAYFEGNADANFIVRPGKLGSGIAELVAESQGMGKESFYKSVLSAGLYFQKGKIQLDAQADFKDPATEAALASLGGHLSKDMLALCPVAKPQMLMGFSFNNQAFAKMMKMGGTSPQGLPNKLLRDSGLTEEEFMALFSGQALAYLNVSQENTTPILANRQEAFSMFLELSKPEDLQQALVRMSANNAHISEVEPGKLFLIDDEYDGQNWLALRDNYLLWAAGAADAQAFLNGPLQHNVLGEEYTSLSKKGSMFIYFKGGKEDVNHIEFYSKSATTARCDVFFNDDSQNALQILLDNRKAQHVQ